MTSLQLFCAESNTTQEYTPTQYEESKLYTVLKNYSSMMQYGSNTAEFMDFMPGTLSLSLATNPAGMLAASSLLGLGILSSYALMTATRNLRFIERYEKELQELLANQPHQTDRISELKNHIEEHKTELAKHKYLITELKKEGITPKPTTGINQEILESAQKLVEHSGTYNNL